MRFNNLKATLKTAVLVTTVLLLGAGLAVAQQTVNLTAGPANVALPDGSIVPMWGYTACAVSGTALATGAQTCAYLNPLAAGTFTPVGSTTPTWSPVVITVPAGQDLTINLTNNLSFTAGTGTNTVPTSLVIVGQLGGGLGTTATSIASPNHSQAQANLTWPIAGPGAGAGVPPTQGNRVQSFAGEVTAVAAGTAVTCTAPSATSATGCVALTWTAPRPGTYLLESGTHPSIQGPMGLYGIVVVTTAPVGTTAGTAYPAVGTTPATTYNAEIPLLFSEIDPVQNNAVNAAVTTAGFSETMVWSGQPGGCGNPSSTTYHQCYPPAVNYTPLYYLINGLAFNKTNAAASLFPASLVTGVTAGTPGSVLVRLVNAGLRMHVPSIVGSQTGTAVAPALPPAGFSLIAEDGNPLPGVPRVQSEVFMAAGKTYDVMINVPAAGTTALPVYDRELSLSGNAIARDSGMLAYISVNGALLPAAPALATGAQANPDTYNSVISGHTFTISDPGKGVIANDVNVFGVQLLTAPTGGTLALNSNGTFTYTANAGTTSDSFTYCANGSVTAAVCSSGLTATVTLGAAPIEGASGITCTIPTPTYTSNVATTLSIKPPGVLAFCKDAAGYPLTIAATPAPTLAGGTVAMDPNGGFTATVGAAGTHNLTFSPQNSQGTVGASATAALVFPAANGPTITVVDGRDKTTPVTDYRWIIEEDRTFYVNPACTTNPPAAGCPTVSIAGLNTPGIVSTFGTNFHTSYMPLVATGCTGPLSCESGQTLLGAPTVCDIGNGVCESGANAGQQATLDPRQVYLDPTKRYYISVLPGDAANSFENVNSCLGNATPSCGHGMGGAPIACVPVAPAVSCTSTGTFPAVTVLVQPNPFPPSKLSVFVFEDDFPLNGEQDGGGGIDVLSPNEPGLGGFNITLFDDAGGTGDATGQMTYDMFNQPLSNSLAGTVDPATGLDACPLSKQELIGVNSSNGNAYGSVSPTGITGTIVTCPKYEADNQTLSPLAGQAVVANLMPGRYGVVATPAADRIARGEEWLQTNTLDGQKAHDSFLRIGEPSFFQEYGPAGYHVSIGFANPAIINARKPYVCNGTDPTISGSNCTNTLTGHVSMERMSRTPDERLYGSGSYSAFGFTQCYVSFGDADGEDFAFTKCNPNDGSFTLTGLPDGDWRVTVFDQWNDMLVDGLSTPVRLAGGTTTDLGELAINQWQANIYTSTFFDANGDGIRQPTEAGLTLVPTNIRFRDGSYSNFNNTDLSGNAGFNEVFPLFSWYVIETDSTRYKNTGTHVVYDAGGPADGTCTSGTAPCGSSTIAANMANTAEVVSVPTSERVPGAIYCADADCSTHQGGATFGPLGGGTGSDSPSVCTVTTGTGPTAGQITCSTQLSTGRLDPAWVTSEGWQGFSGQNSFIEFGKRPFAAGENGGIRGEVIYASTRPFDDPTLLIHTSWTPDVPGVTINLYQEGTAPDGTQSLQLVDTTKTSSWDDWAQGFRSDGVPNMNCPGQGRDTGAAADLFFFTLYNQPMWLDEYTNVLHGTSATEQPLPANSQYKCYDGMHNWNQVQPAPYDGAYQFPSIAGRNPQTGVPVGGTGSVAGTNCTVCVADPIDGTPMLPAGKYVVEMIVPPGYELVKEEDKNILIGDNYIAPVTQEFGGLGNITILPDQAEVSSNPGTCDPTTSPTGCNWQQSTQNLGRESLPQSEGDTGSVEVFWPCVGAQRIVPDYISLFPQSGEVSPFAGATRNLCDRKEVTLTDQTSALAKFWVFTSAHAAAHFTGIITDDFTSEFDPFSPVWGEKFSPANLPVSIKDWSGTEISRVYSDQWGDYDGLTYSTWEVNPPNPTGYAPTMMVTCMNDPGTGSTPDPLFNPEYSDFCYEIPFMPGQTQYMDTPVVPTSAFAGAGYDNPDCAYPDATPAIASVTSVDIAGPWVSAPNHNITITALGDVTVGTTTTNQNVMVDNYGYTGPSATTAPFNLKKVGRHYGFGARGAGSRVTIGGATATIVSWSDTQIVATVSGSVPACAVQQQVQYGNPNTTGAPGQATRCGELVITAANGKQSIDTVTVTVGGKRPTVLAAGQTIQSAIDGATPGDMIIVPPGTYNEMLIMWKPVRLQGVGATSSILNANTHPAGKMDAWRQKVNCLFGLALNGTPITATNPYDSTGTAACGSTNGTTWTYFQPFGGAGDFNPQIDRLPLEATVGWDASLNGNLAELLQEPSLMGALEGAGITVLSKGVNFPSNPFDSTLAAGFPAGTTLLLGTPNATGVFPTGDANALCHTSTSNTTNPFPSNFQCNPSSIDGLTITDSSQGGGGIFVHGWGHNIQIANNRITNNAGTLSGGINVGQGEHPGVYLAGSATNASPDSCQTSAVTNLALPYCFDMNVNVHNNAVTSNSSTGDELFSATPAGAGGASFCSGSDYYKFNYNWVCGNLSSGDGGGFGHLGFSYNGDIEHNSVIFNQSTNPTIAANGGGILIMGAPDVDPPCGIQTDLDCLPPLGSVGPSDGAGPGLVINANLIMGNAAEAGSGGGLRLQNVNGSEVVSFPTTPAQWYAVSITNNIIANNVAGWDGAGISLWDALNVNIVNNTIISNDTTASSGVLFNTLGAPLASSQGPCPGNINPSATNPCVTASTPQPSGLVSIQNSAVLTANLTGSSLTCPAGHFAPGTSATGTVGTTSAPTCAKASYPELYNNVFWQNRTFNITVGSLGTGTVNQQNTVALVPTLNQTATGQCPAGANYWDIGVRGDTGPGNHASSVTLAPMYSVLTSISGYNGASLHNTASNPTVVTQYCNGSRVPPENGGMGYQVPPGISDATVPNPIFNLTPAATVDEGNNWINISWGPLSMTNPSVTGGAYGNYGGGLPLGNYSPQGTSPILNYVPCATGSGTCTVTGEIGAVPSTDFFGNPRPDAGRSFDVGAVELSGH